MRGKAAKFRVDTCPAEGCTPSFRFVRNCELQNRAAARGSPHLKFPSICADALSLVRMGVDPETRQNFDKRTLRRMYKESFASGIAGLQAQAYPRMHADVPSTYVYARKRPMFPEEMAQQDFDVVHTQVGGVVVHDCRMKASLKSGYMSLYSYPLQTFGDGATNEDVYKGIELQQMLDFAEIGGMATCCMFGQTGSGKSYTMAGILGATCELLFQSTAGQDVQYTLTCYEVCGKNCYDLLRERDKVQTREGSAGKFQTTAQPAAIKTRHDLAHYLNIAMENRSSSSTAKNADSSRSHAFYQLINSAGGMVMFVDLAGSERATDSLSHNAEQQKQSAEINASLSALKECFRVKSLQAANQLPPDARIPYRDSLLTKLLRDALEVPPERGRFIVVATVSPSSHDTEHSMTTLRHACVMAGLDMPTDRAALAGEVDVPILKARGKLQPCVQSVELPPAKWDHERLKKWLAGVEHGAFGAVARRLQISVDGRAFSRYPLARVTQLCEGDPALGLRLYQAFRDKVKAASEAKASAAMTAANIAVQK